MRGARNGPVALSKNKSGMKVLVVGGGGREHALCWKIAQSPKVSEVICAPGNPGMDGVARVVGVKADDVDGLVTLAKGEGVELVIVGPEAPLVLGLADRLRAEGIDVFGPGADGARLEGSKAFTKELLERHRIPTGMSRQFDRSGLAKSYLETVTDWPVVVKADGLAGGKGVFICEDARSAVRAVDRVMEERSLGDAGERIIIEEFLKGEETSVHAITDGQTILILEPVMDHKQVGDGDTGPNTGGMGVYSPVTSLTKRVLRQIEQRVLVPVIHALRREGIEFRGVLFAGLMITDSGPQVLEFNVRFGDPEMQAIARRFQSDLVPYLQAAAKGDLSSVEPPQWNTDSCVGVVGAAEGYPDTPRIGDPIEGLDAANAVDNVVVFHAGTREEDGRIVTAGGRVVCVTSLSKDLEAAREAAYAGYDALKWDGKFCRRDIGTRQEARQDREDAPADDEPATRSV